MRWTPQITHAGSRDPNAGEPASGLSGMNPTFGSLWIFQPTQAIEVKPVPANEEEIN